MLIRGTFLEGLTLAIRGAVLFPLVTAKVKPSRKVHLISTYPVLEALEDGSKETREEGCLSLPGIHEPVPRIEKIRLKWLDENFQPHDEVIEGYLARVVQHEYDHLEGKVFIDRISPIRKQLIKSKLTNIIKGKVRCDYRVKATPLKK